MEGFQLWSIKTIARFLDASENYTRNVLVKQPGFPEPRYAVHEVGGRRGRSKPRWISSEVIEWVNKVYTVEGDVICPEPVKRQGRPRSIG